MYRKRPATRVTRPSTVTVSPTSGDACRTPWTLWMGVAGPVQDGAPLATAAHASATAASRAAAAIVAMPCAGARAVAGAGVLQGMKSMCLRSTAFEYSNCHGQGLRCACPPPLAARTVQGEPRDATRWLECMWRARARVEQACTRLDSQSLYTPATMTHLSTPSKGTSAHTSGEEMASRGCLDALSARTKRPLLTFNLGGQRRTVLRSRRRAWAARLMPPPTVNAAARSCGALTNVP